MSVIPDIRMHTYFSIPAATELGARQSILPVSHVYFAAREIAVTIS